jgi:hypothetical protein
VGHTSLEADESAKMWLLGLVILWPGPDAAANVAGAATWEETEGTTAWSTELTMRHRSKGRTKLTRFVRFLNFKDSVRT